MFNVLMTRVELTLSCFCANILTLLIATAGSLAAAESSADPNAHLTGWWKLNESSGSVAADSARPGHPAECKGTFTFASNSVESGSGRALSFPGGESYLTVPNCKGVTGPSARTIATWIKTSNPSGEIISWGTPQPGKRWLFSFIRGRPGVTPGAGYLYMKSDIADDQWHHIAVVVHQADPPNLHDHVKLYKDGVLAEIDDIGLLDLFPIETGDKQDVRIGWHFKGALRDVRIYDAALSEDQVKAVFQSAAAIKP